MSRRRPEIPDRVFTVCRVLSAEDQERRYSYDRDNPSAGFIFTDRKEPLHPRITSRLMRNEAIREALGPYYVGGEYRWSPGNRSAFGNSPSASYMMSDPRGMEHGIVINQANWCTPSARNEHDARLYIMDDGELIHTSTDVLYDHCRELHRLMGCDKCPKSSDQCTRVNSKFGHTQLTLPDVVSPYRDFRSDRFLTQRAHAQFHWEDFKDLEWKYWQTEIEGFLLIPPGLAAGGSLRPGQSLEHPYELRLQGDALRSAREAMSLRAQEAAKTRRTKQQHCEKCYFGGRYGACYQHAPKWCKHGAWTEAQVIDLTLDAFKVHLERNGLTVRQFEQVLAISGETFYMTAPRWGSSHYKVVVRGFTAESATGEFAKARFTLLRVGGDERGTPLDFTRTEEFLAVLPENLRRTYENARSLPRETLALAAQATCARAVKSYPNYYFQRVEPQVSDVCVRGAQSLVQVGYWVKSYWRNHVLSSMSDVHSFFGALPMFSITQADFEGGELIRYHYWPR